MVALTLLVKELKDRLEMVGGENSKEVRRSPSLEFKDVGTCHRETGRRERRSANEL